MWLKERTSEFIPITSMCSVCHRETPSQTSLDVWHPQKWPELKSHSWMGSVDHPHDNARLGLGSDCSFVCWGFFNRPAHLVEARGKGPVEVSHSSPMSPLVPATASEVSRRTNCTADICLQSPWCPVPLSLLLESFASACFCVPRSGFALTPCTSYLPRKSGAL